MWQQPVHSGCFSDFEITNHTGLLWVFRREGLWRHSLALHLQPYYDRYWIELWPVLIFCRIWIVIEICLVELVREVNMIATDTLIWIRGKWTNTRNWVNLSQIIFLKHLQFVGRCHMNTSWYEKVLRITGTLWRQTTSGVFPLQSTINQCRAQMISLMSIWTSCLTIRQVTGDLRRQDTHGRIQWKCLLTYRSLNTLWWHHINVK